MTVWNLETASEDVASWELSKLIQTAIDNKDDGLITYIRALWDNESWESIVRKVETEGSTWYVWWMDGVRAFMREGDNEES